MKEWIEKLETEDQNILAYSYGLEIEGETACCAFCVEAETGAKRNAKAYFALEAARTECKTILFEKLMKQKIDAINLFGLIPSAQVSNDQS